MLKASSICDPSVFLKEAAGFHKDPDYMRGAFWKIRQVMKEIFGPEPTVEHVANEVGFKRVKLYTGHVHWLCDVHSSKKAKDPSVNIFRGKKSIEFVI